MTGAIRRLLVGSVIVAVGASGCASSDTSGPSSSRSPSHGPTATLPPGVTGATDVPAKVPNRADWRKDVTLAACRSATGGWAASGTVHNPAKDPRVYRLTVFFTTTSATVIGVGHSKVRVPAGASQTWQVAARFKAPPKTLCVLRGVG